MESPSKRRAPRRSRASIWRCSAPAPASRAFSPPAARDRGAWVIDNSSAFRADPDCPLVIPEVNAETLDPVMQRGESGHRRQPELLHHPAGHGAPPPAQAGRDPAGRGLLLPGGLRAGATAIEELRLQEEAEGRGEPPIAAVFPRSSPTRGAVGGRHRGPTVLGGSAGRPRAATCVRVPVWRAHSEAVHVELGPRSGAQRGPGRVPRRRRDRRPRSRFSDAARGSREGFCAYR